MIELAERTYGAIYGALLVLFQNPSSSSHVQLLQASVWLACGLGLARGSTRWYRAARMTARRRRPTVGAAGSSVARRLRVLSRRLGMRTVPEFVEVDDQGPPIYVEGVLRPRVCAAPRLLGLLEPAQLDVLLLHELHHVRRRDPLRTLLGNVLLPPLVLLVAYAFGMKVSWELYRSLPLPFALGLVAVGAVASVLGAGYGAYRQERAAELACDRAAARRTGRPRDVARTIVRFASLSAGVADHAGQRVAAFASSVSERLLRQRVRRLLAPPRRRDLAVNVVVLLAGMAFAVLAVTYHAANGRAYWSDGHAGYAQPHLCSELCVALHHPDHVTPSPR